MPVPELGVELFYGGAWQDITEDGLAREPATLKRGRADESSSAEPSQLSMLVRNKDGRYSPRNPASPLYGLIGRNTPIRLRRGPRDTALVLDGQVGDYASTPDQASLDVTGDLDVRVEISPESWRPDLFTVVAAKGEDNDGGSLKLSWGLRILPSGDVELTWSPDGSTRINDASTVPVPQGTGRLAVRAVLDVDNGSGAYEVSYYTADTIDGPWTQLGDTIVGGSTTQVNASGAALALGALGQGGLLFTNGSTFAGRIHAFQLHNGINGPAVADVDIATADPGDATFTGANGLVWTVHGAGDLADRSVRFTGEVAAWPPRWDHSGTDVYDPIEAAGILRRLGNAAAPLRSALYRGTVAAQPVAYWPLEDGEDSTVLASALDGGTPMAIVRQLKLAAFDGYASSEPIPQMVTGQAVGLVADHDETGQWQVQMLLSVPTDGVPTGGARLLEVRTTGSARRFDVQVSADGKSLRMLIYDPTGAVLEDSGFVVFDEAGLHLVRFALEVEQNGSDVDWAFASVQPGASIGGVAGGTVQGVTAGRVSRVSVGGEAGEDLGDTAIGHVSARDEITSLFALSEETNAWRGEAAARRIERLCAEEGVPLKLHGDPDATAAMGPQAPETLLTLLSEAAQADLGILGELGDRLGLSYRVHESLYNRAATVTLDYEAGELSPPLEPTADDQGLVNDVTVSRRDGSSSRAVQKTGPLSIQPPPEGVGRYDSSVDLNLHTDEQTVQQAAWRLHLGTVDELRYPTITVSLTSNPQLAQAIGKLDQGDLIRLANLPAWVPPGAAELTLQGTQETHNEFRWEWQGNTSPASPYAVFEVESPQLGRLATDGSLLAADVGASATTLPVAVAAGPFWTDDPADLPLNIEVGGEVIRVDAVADNGGTALIGADEFEDGTLAPFRTSGDALWFVQSAVTDSGTAFAAQSGNVAGGQSSTMSVLLDAPQGATVSFAFKVSSELSFDHLRFFLNGTFQQEWSGEVGWQRTVEFPVEMGQNTLTWVYVKDGSVSGGSDAAWVDTLVITGTVLDFTVTRSVNGIVKAHKASDQVQLHDPGVLALGQAGQNL